MESSGLATGAPPRAAAEGFSLFAGGPAFRLLSRMGLDNGALGLLGRRIVFAVAITWAPLLILSAFEHHLFGTGAALPFAKDIACHVRFLVVVPLLLWAEPFVNVRMRGWVEQFFERDLVPEREVPRFEAALASGLSLRRSVMAEVVMVALVYAVGIFVVWRNFMSLEGISWYDVSAGTHVHATLAGLWYVWVSIPIFQFLMCRWYFRLFIWARFLWQVSRLHLNLLATHPDRAGGLGFLTGSLRASYPLVIAHGALVAGQIANRIFYAGDKLPEFILEIAYVAAFVVAVVIGPLLVFSPRMALVRRNGMRAYGGLAQTYMLNFDRKWLRGGAPADEPLLGSADIQSLADLGNSFGVVEGMRLTAMSQMQVVEFVAVFLAPIVPLALTMMPAEKLLKSLLGLVL